MTIVTNLESVMSTDRRRTSRINVRLTDEQLERLNSIAEEQGIATATLTTQIVGEWLAEQHRKEVNQNKQIKAMTLVFRDEMRKMLEQSLSPEQMEKAQGVFDETMAGK